MGVSIGLKLLGVPLGPMVFSLNQVLESTLVESCPGIPLTHTLAPYPPKDGWMSVDREVGGSRPKARDFGDLDGPRNKSSNL